MAGTARHVVSHTRAVALNRDDIQSRPAALRSTRRQSTRLKSSVLIEAYQRPLPNARRRMPFQSELTVSGVAAFIPAVCAADCTVDELVAPGGRAWESVSTAGRHCPVPRRRQRSYRTIRLIIAVTPPYDDAVHSGVVVLVHEILARELFNLARMESSTSSSQSHSWTISPGSKPNSSAFCDAV